MMEGSITPEEMATYRVAAARRRRERERRAVLQRERAWQVAHRAAKILLDEFGATRVVAFGSLVRESAFDTRSDIDLAAWGVSDQLYFRALSRLLSIEPSFSVDLIRGEDASGSLLAEIESQGVVL